MISLAYDGCQTTSVSPLANTSWWFNDLSWFWFGYRTNGSGFYKNNGGCQAAWHMIFKIVECRFLLDSLFRVNSKSLPLTTSGTSGVWGGELIYGDCGLLAQLWRFCWIAVRSIPMRSKCGIMFVTWTWIGPGGGNHISLAVGMPHSLPRDRASADHPSFSADPFIWEHSHPES